jgi:hypothetical protein
MAKTMAAVAATEGTMVPTFKKSALLVGLGAEGVVVMAGRGATEDVGITGGVTVVGSAGPVVTAVGRGFVGTGPSPRMTK